MKKMAEMEQKFAEEMCGLKESHRFEISLLKKELEKARHSISIVKYFMFGLIMYVICISLKNVK